MGKKIKRKKVRIYKEDSCVASRVQRGGYDLDSVYQSRQSTGQTLVSRRVNDLGSGSSLPLQTITKSKDPHDIPIPNVKENK